MAEDFDDCDEDDWDDEVLPCSSDYMLCCITMPFLDGNLGAFAWPGFNLYYAEMGWSPVNSGLAVTVGYAMRVVCQQCVRMFGFWAAIPLAAIHLTVAILAFMFTTSEWAIFMQVVAFICFAPTAVIEGIVFDCFGSSELLARQATSTVLSVYTLSKALASTVGGLIYDFFGWKGIAFYHVMLQGLLLLVFLIQSSCRRSFMDVFFSSPEIVDSEDTDTVAGAELTQVVPSVKSARASASPQPSLNIPEGQENREVIESVESMESQGQEDHQTGTALPQDTTSWKSMTQSPARKPQNVHLHGDEESVIKVESVGSAESQEAAHEATKNRKSARDSRASRKSQHSSGTGTRGALRHLRRSLGTSQTSQTAGTMRTLSTALTKMTKLTELGEGLQPAMGLDPTILTSRGGSGVARHDVKSEWEEQYGEVLEETEPQAKSQKSIPRDLWLPTSLILSSCLCHLVGGVTMYSRYAIFFREVHDFDATYSGMCQTVGDVLAAMVIKLIPLLFDRDFDPDDASWFQRNWHYLVSQPYNVSLNLLAWVLVNLAIIAPPLPVAVTAHIVMSSCFVYLQKNNMEMNLFYSLGDQELFISLQFLAKNFQATGGLVAGFGTAALYSIDPRFPFVFMAALALVTCLMVTVGFCRRVGFGDNIENAEAKRARRRGQRRVSSWATASTTRRTTQSRPTQSSQSRPTEVAKVPEDEDSN